MTTAPTPVRPVTRAEMQLRQRRRGRRRGAPPVGRRRANTVLGVIAVVLVATAAACGVVAFLTWQEANESRDATKPLEVRAAQLRADLTTSETTIARMTALFAALGAQGDATTKAVAAANHAAQQYNTAESGMADALGADVPATVETLTQTTTEVRAAADQVNAVLAELVGSATGAANG
jgi:hypothetical protein